MDGITHTYLLDGTKILRETWGENTLIPIYDNEESVCGIIYNNVPYYFQKNLQGDVIAITNEYGTVVGAYRYDAWGANVGIITCTELTDGVEIANINPFRYRSYYFDQDIGMYYLQSRYYDPQLARFINADDVENFEYLNGPLDLNLFAYTVNCPIFLTDGCGEGWLKDQFKKAANTVKKAATAVVGATKKVVSSVTNGIKNVCTSVGDFFTNTVWKKWLVDGLAKTFCKKWVWEKFCKEMVYNTAIKKWVWQTFCKKWTWQTFCKKWVWETFCKKWVWQTFFKDWVANKAWNWLKSNWKQVVDAIGFYGGAASWAIEVFEFAGIISLSQPFATALLIFGGVCLVWDVLSRFDII